MTIAEKRARPDTFIKVTEIWELDYSGKGLRLRSGIYGDCTTFKNASERSGFAWGEGLPGRAWAQRRPVIWRDIHTLGFRRLEAAKADGLTMGVALPIFSGHALVAVIVFFCGDDAPQFGAIEVWSPTTPTHDALALEDGHYGELSELEALSRSLQFKRGYGLPGVVWEVGRPCVMSEIGNSGSFFRAPAALKGRLTSALGIPCSWGGDNPSVLCLLSSSIRPIARRYEIWVPTNEGDSLRQAFVVGDGEDAWGNEDSAARLAKGEGPLGRVWEQRRPLACPDLALEGSSPMQNATASGLTCMVALPTFRNGDVSSVVAWYY